MAPLTDGLALRPLGIELLLRQAGHFSHLDRLQPFCPLPCRVEDTQSLENLHPVGPPRFVIFRHTQREEAPGRHHPMITFIHVAGLARRSAPRVRLDLPDGAMLGGGPHLPVGMVEAHVTGLACPRVAGFSGGEAMPGMARIATGGPVAIVGLCKFFR